MCQENWYHHPCQHTTWVGTHPCARYKLVGMLCISQPHARVRTSPAITTNPFLLASHHATTPPPCSNPARTPPTLFSPLTIGPPISDPAGSILERCIELANERNACAGREGEGFAMQPLPRREGKEGMTNRVVRVGRNCRGCVREAGWKGMWGLTFEDRHWWEKEVEWNARVSIRNSWREGFEEWVREKEGRREGEAEGGAGGEVGEQGLEQVGEEGVDTLVESEDPSLSVVSGATSDSVGSESTDASTGSETGTSASVGSKDYTLQGAVTGSKRKRVELAQDETGRAKVIRLD